MGFSASILQTQARLPGCSLGGPNGRWPHGGHQVRGLRKGPVGPECHGIWRIGPSSGAQSPPWRKGGPCQASVGMPLPPRPPAGLPPSSLPLDHMFFQASWGTDDQADKPLSRGQGCLQKARDKAERQCRACGFPAAGRGGPHGQRGRDSRGPTPPGLTLCQAWCQPPLGDKVNPSLLPATTSRGQRKDQSWYFLHAVPARSAFHHYLV